MTKIKTKNVSGFNDKTLANLAETAKIEGLPEKLIKMREDLNSGFSQEMVDAGIQKRIADGTIANMTIADNSITGAKIKNNEITGDKLGEGTLRLNPASGSFDFVDFSTLNWTGGKFYNGGDIADNANWSICETYIPTNGVKTFLNSGDTILQCFNESKVYLEIKRNRNAGEITVSDTTAYIRIAIHSTGTGINDYALRYSGVGYYNFPTTIDGKQLKFEGELFNASNCDNSIVKLIATKNLFNKNTVTSGYLINWNTGGLLENSSYVYSDFIPVEASTNYHCNVPIVSSLYDRNKNFISGSNNVSDIMTTSNTSYIRISIKTDFYNVDTVQLEKGNKYTGFVEYGYTVPSEYNGVNIIYPGSSINPYEKSRLYGKKVSWYGTSITQGYGWCELVNKKFNFTATNNGVGGTAICNEGIASMCNLTRMQGRYSNVTDSNTGQVTTTGVAIPSDVDIIFIEGGTNDWARNWAIGTEKFSTTPNDQTFYGACDKMFDNLTTLFPNAEIIIVGAPFGKMANRDQFTDKYGVLNNQELQTVDYGEILLKCANRWGLKGFNMGTQMQINDNNISELIPDGLHLTTNEAKKRAADAICCYFLSL